MHRWEEVVDFPRPKVEVMREIIRKKRADLKAKGIMVNAILRDDIFKLLNACCTVVFYPFPEDENDGFQVSRPVNYGALPHIEQFVYLNTAKPLVKQVFTVGHELGHIWAVADFIWDDDLEPMLPREKYEEAAMNRFAAELLMPCEEFSASAKRQLAVYRQRGTLAYSEGLYVIANLMNEFCVPMLAAGLRLYETGCISAETCRRLLFAGPNRMSEEQYQAASQKLVTDYIRENGYTRLTNPTNKKGIADFPEVLREVETRKVFSPKRIEKLRAELGIPEIQVGLDEERLE